MMSIDRGTQTANSGDKENGHQNGSSTPNHYEHYGSLMDGHDKSLPVYAEPEDMHEAPHEQLGEIAEGPAIVSKARLVTIRKHTPPTLPSRNPDRGIQPLTPRVDPLEQHKPVSRDAGTGGSSPGKDGFDEVPLNGMDHKPEENGLATTEGHHIAAESSKEEEKVSHSTAATSPALIDQPSRDPAFTEFNGRSEADEDRFHSVPSTPV